MNSVRFGAYELDLHRGELRRRRVRIRLSAQPLEILKLLVEHPAQIITREQIRSKLWPAGMVVDFEHSINTNICRLRKALHDCGEKPRYIETLPRRGYRFIAEVRTFGSSNGRIKAEVAWEEPADSERKTDAVAVLPFENASGDPEADYLAEGIAERLINSLSQLRWVRVIPSSTTFRLRGQKKDAQCIARELNVRSVLMGKLWFRGDDLVVSAHLVDVSRQAQLWGGRYRKKVVDLLAIEEDLAREMANGLHLRFSKRKRLRERGTECLEAYQLFLKAQHNIRKWTLEGMMRGMAYCRQALDADPCYAAPHALMGQAYEQLGHGGILKPTEAFPLAKAEAVRALQLSEKEVEARLVLAMVRLFFEWDWAGAEGEFRRALALAPNYARAHQAYANLLMGRGELEKAIERVETAISLDPLASEFHYHLGLLYSYKGWYEQSLQALSVAMELNPDSPLAPLQTSWILSQRGHCEEAISTCKDFLRRANRASGTRAYLAWTLMWKAHLAWAYAWAGRREDAKSMLSDVERELGEGYAACVFAATVYCFLGQTEKCLALLERGIQDRIGCLVLMDRNPVYERMRGNPRFETIRRWIGLSELKVVEMSA